MYQFNNSAIKRDKRSYKWQVLEAYEDLDILPFGLAEMEWPTAPEITDGLKEYLDKQILGYTKPSPEYYKAVLNWHKNYYGIDAKAEDIMITPGVISALLKLIPMMVKEDEAVILLTPSYPSFFKVLELHKRSCTEVMLKREKGAYTIDFDLLEKAMRDEKNTCMILCNPHNPVGRSWTPAELSQVAALANKHHVQVISDEIHGDLIMPGFKHNSYHHFDPNAIICTAASKSFNLAGLKTSNIFIFDPVLRQAYRQEAQRSGSDGANALGLLATEIAYTQGRKWLDEAISHIHANYQNLCEKLKDTQIEIAPLEASYLSWLNFSAYDAEKIFEQLEQEHHIFANRGFAFSKEAKCCLRLNIAVPSQYIDKCCAALIEVIDKLQ